MAFVSLEESGIRSTFTLMASNYTGILQFSQAIFIKGIVGFTYSYKFLYFEFDMSGPTSCCPEGCRKNLKVQALELDKAATMVCSLEMTSFVSKPVTPSRKTC